MGPSVQGDTWSPASVVDTLIETSVQILCLIPRVDPCAYSLWLHFLILKSCSFRPLITKDERGPCTKEYRQPRVAGGGKMNLLEYSPAHISILAQ